MPSLRPLAYPWRRAIPKRASPPPSPPPPVVEPMLLSATKTAVPPPTQEQLVRHFANSTVPFVGFGFMDNSIMLYAGNFIDCSIGVSLGISTLAAAAIGQIVANGMSVLFGGYVESLAYKVGLPPAGLNSKQKALSKVRSVGICGNFIGVVVGATLGLVNLLFIDTGRAADLKLEAMAEESEFAFTVEASNSKRPDGTVFTVRGPDADGLLASMSSALTASGCTVHELHANSSDDDSDNKIEDVFVVRRHKQKLGDDELDGIARKLLAASRDPLMAHSLKTQNEELIEENRNLQLRIEKIVSKLEDRQISIEHS